eukprot:11769367-Alexandrium_andersonii.AAC.3
MPPKKKAGAKKSASPKGGMAEPDPAADAAPGEVGSAVVAPADGPQQPQAERAEVPPEVPAATLENLFKAQQLAKPEPVVKKECPDPHPVMKTILEQGGVAESSNKVAASPSGASGKFSQPCKLLFTCARSRHQQCN